MHSKVGAPAELGTPSPPAPSPRTRVALTRLIIPGQDIYLPSVPNRASRASLWLYLLCILAFALQLSYILLHPCHHKTLDCFSHGVLHSDPLFLVESWVK